MKWAAVVFFVLALALAGPVVTVVSPNGGESFSGAQAAEVKFNVDGLGTDVVPATVQLWTTDGNVRAEVYRIFNGFKVANGVNTLSWTVPQLTGTNFRVNVQIEQLYPVEGGYTYPKDESDADFGITATGAEPSSGGGGSSASNITTNIQTAIISETPSNDLVQLSELTYTLVPAQVDEVAFTVKNTGKTSVSLGKYQVLFIGNGGGYIVDGFDYAALLTNTDRILAPGEAVRITALGSRRFPSFATEKQCETPIRIGLIRTDVLGTGSNSPATTADIIGLTSLTLKCFTEEAKPLVITETKPTEPTVAQVSCSVDEAFMARYNELISALKEAEVAGNRDVAALITEKITALKQEVYGSQTACRTAAAASTVTQIAVPTVTPTDACKEQVVRWEEKMTYYRKLLGLTNDQLARETGFTREGVNRIIADLNAGLAKVRAECNAGQAISAVKPVAVERGGEITDYYRARLANITTKPDINQQITELKQLRGEIDGLIENLLSSRKEFDTTEITPFAARIEIRANEIKADDVSVDGTGKKLKFRLENKNVSLEPGEDNVFLRDGETEVESEELSVQEETLKVGDAVVQVAPAEMIARIKIIPKRITLVDENGNAVYKITSDEERRFLFVVPVTFEKETVADAASDGSIIRESVPWWAFLAFK